jgi:hypothetical protein
MKSTLSTLMSIVLFFLAACNNNRTSDIDAPEELKPTFDSLYLKKNVKIAIDSFLKEANCIDCIDEIYVDKILPDSMVITLKARAYSPAYMKQINSLFTLNIKGHLFFVYTGLEDILKGNKKLMLMRTDTLSNKFFLWTLIVRRDSLSIIKSGYLPFFPGQPPRIEIIK